MRVVWVGLFIGFLVGCQQHSSSSLVQQDSVTLENPRAAQTNIKLGMSYLQQGDIQRAKQKLLRALKQDPKSSLVNSTYAFYLEKTDDNTQAKYYYEKAIRLAPREGGPLNNFGAFHCRQKNYAQAEHYFLRAIKDPKYVNKAQAYENAGLCAKQANDLAKAKGYFEKAVANNPQLSSAWLELARIAFGENKLDLASKMIKNYQKVGPVTVNATRLAHQISEKQLGQHYE